VVLGRREDDAGRLRDDLGERLGVGRHSARRREIHAGRGDDVERDAVARTDPAKRGQKVVRLVLLH